MGVSYDVEVLFHIHFGLERAEHFRRKCLDLEN
jgi:hypothetical protein